MRKARIGLFDSGIGGLSVLQEIVKIMPGEEYYYIADDAYVPYGSKSEVEILERSHVLTKMLFEKNVDIIVVACNTATAVSIAELRKNYQIPFVGIEPYLNFQNKIKESHPEYKMVVLTTRATGDSSKFKKLKESLDPENKIDHHGHEKLAMIIEKAFYDGMTKEVHKEIEKELSPLKNKGYTHAILGCTHYPLISNIIEDVLDVECVSPAPFVALRAKTLLLEKDLGREHSRSEVFHYLSTLNDLWIDKDVFQIQITATSRRS